MKRRKPLPRSTAPIARSALPNRSGPPPKRNPKRASRAFIHAYESLARKKWVRGLPCVVRGCLTGPCDNAHVSRNAGAGLKGPSHEVVPMCRYHHRGVLHQHGWATFTARCGWTQDALLVRAAEIETEWRRLGGEYGG